MKKLTIVADDYGFGPETSRAILELANSGHLQGTVLMVNSPYAPQAVREWQLSQPNAELGWHPTLTSDRPISDPQLVPSLVAKDGNFYPLKQFLQRIVLGKFRASEVEVEWQAQLQRFQELTGHLPQLVNCHQHCGIFPPVSKVWHQIVSSLPKSTYVRNVVESPKTLCRIQGARIKRAILSTSHRLFISQWSGNPQNNALVGVTDPKWVADPDFLIRWVKTASTATRLEICCHPGYRDESLIGRDCSSGELIRREDERKLLLDMCLRRLIGELGYQIVLPTEMQ